MSSHHVIRDEQEPPVFILDTTESIDLLKQLLGWSPTVWVIEAAAEWAMSLDIKIDGILTYEPKKHEKINQQSGEYKLKRINQADLLPSLFHLLENKMYTGMNIFCNQSQRAIILDDIGKEAINLPITLITDFETTIVSKKRKFRKWYPKGQMIGILQGDLLENENLQQQKENYLVKKDGIVQINSEDSIIIIKEI
jgi:hypothetical protein